MAKDKRKKKMLQGMEHLKAEIEHDTTVDKVSQVKVPKSSVEHLLLKKDLIFIILLMSLFFLVLVCLMVFDKMSDNLGIFAEKVTSLFIK